MSNLQALNSKRTLVLNADFQPLSYAPLSTLPWDEAIKDVFNGKYNVVAEYQDVFVHSPSTQIRLPAVVSVKEYVKPKRKVAFTRLNVWLRDKYTCQMCGQRFPGNELTYDHVHPRSKGGKSSWENIVAACVACNLRKGDKSLKEAGMTLLKEPVRPTWQEFYEAGRSVQPDYIAREWDDFLYWNVELDQS